MIVVSADVGGHTVVLAERRAWADRGVDGRAAVQQDPITTELTPKVVPEKGSTTWLLTGYRLTEHDAPGDTLVTYSFLLEIDAAGAVSGWWYEDHMEVPRSLWKVDGALAGRLLTLSLTGEEPRRVTGLLHRR